MKRLFHRSTLLVLFLCLISAGTFYAQNPKPTKVLKVRRLSMRDGLSSNNVHSLFQDSKGFMWVGTGVGLDKYDGHTFKKYLNDPDDPNEYYGAWTSNITEDSAGTIWLHPQDLVSDGN